MADVFAADRVIWVEGQTEELCFPLIYSYNSNVPLPQGVIFTSVMATGDFLSKRRDKELVYQIYKRLSQAAVPLVVKTIFSFDSELLTEREKEIMVRDSLGSINFLPRRLIECYLINAEAIKLLITKKDLYRTDHLTYESVLKKIEEIAEREQFISPAWNGDIESPSWLSTIDAAGLIAEVCAELSDQRITFNKTIDTLMLIRLIREINPDQLKELVVYVRDLVTAIGQ